MQGINMLPASRVPFAFDHCIRNVGNRFLSHFVRCTFFTDLSQEARNRFFREEKKALNFTLYI